MRRFAVPVLLALAAFALLAGCGTTGEDDTTAAEEAQTTELDAAGTTTPEGQDQPLDAAEENGRTLFVENCGSCHTLEAADTQGQIGPNLDEAQVDRDEVLTAIDRGGLGSGTMPADLVQGKEAEDVASFVAGENPAPGD